MTSAVCEKVWNNFNLFASTKESENEETIEFEGKVPDWLNGTLYRNGPGANEVNDDPSTSVYHAFDGFAFLQKYTIDGPSQLVHFRGSFIKSYTYNESLKQGRLITRQFGTDPCKSIFGRFQSVFNPFRKSTHTDDTGVTVQMVNNELLALTETITGNVLDPKTLEFLGPLTGLPYAKSIESEILTITTAHVMYDEKRKMTVGYAERISYKQHWLDVIFIYEDPKETISTNDDEEAKWLNGNGRFINLTKTITERGKEYNRRVRSNTKSFRYPNDAPCYMHSASITEDYLVLSEIPFHFNKLNAAWVGLTGGIATNIFKWYGDSLPTMFRIIHLDTGEEVARIAGPAFFTFHHINSYQSPENPKKIITDICAYDDPRIVDELYLDKLRENIFPSGAGYVRRFEIDLESKTCCEPNANARPAQGVHGISHSHSLIPVQFELPRINPKFNGKPYRFVYVVRAMPGRIFDALVKLDLEKKEQVAIWEEPCTSPSEPIFVPRPDGGEDEGVVLTVVLDQHAKKSFLLVLDGQTLKELARAPLPTHIPLSFHGNFYSALLEDSK